MSGILALAKSNGLVDSREQVGASLKKTNLEGRLTILEEKTAFSVLKKTERFMGKLDADNRVLFEKLCTRSGNFDNYFDNRL